MGLILILAFLERHIKTDFSFTRLVAVFLKKYSNKDRLFQLKWFYLFIYLFTYGCMEMKFSNFEFQLLDKYNVNKNNIYNIHIWSCKTLYEIGFSYHRSYINDMDDILPWIMIQHRNGFRGENVTMSKVVFF